MKVVKILLLLVVSALAFQYWSTHQPKTGPSANGFVTLPMLVGGTPGQVVVFAPENCPSEAAARADSMAHQLASRNIPSLRSHDVSFAATNPEPGIGERLNGVMNGELPIVFVNGKGKANPTLDEVISEYGAK